MAGEKIPERKDWKIGGPTSSFRLNGAASEEEEEKGEQMPCVLRPCIRRHSSEKREKDEWLSRSLRPCIASRTKEEGGVSAVKRKAEEAALSPDGVKPAAAVDAKAGAADGDGGHQVSREPKAGAAAAVVEQVPRDQKWVRMPETYITWLLAKTEEDYPVNVFEDDCGVDPSMSQEEADRQRESNREMNAALQRAHDRFFRFQAWVCNKMEINGRVMVPAGPYGPTPEVEQEIEEIWRSGMKELGLDVNSGSGTTGGH